MRQRRYNRGTPRSITQLCQVHRYKKARKTPTLKVAAEIHSTRTTRKREAAYNEPNCIAQIPPTQSIFFFLFFFSPP